MMLVSLTMIVFMTLHCTALHCTADDEADYFAPMIFLLTALTDNSVTTFIQIASSSKLKVFAARLFRQTFTQPASCLGRKGSV